MGHIDQLLEIISANNGDITIIIKENEKLMLASDVAKKWGSDANYVRELYRRGLLKGIKFSNKTVKFRRQEVEDFEKWAEDKELADLDNITNIRSGEKIYKRF